jgi:inosose dehydratase
MPTNPITLKHEIHSRGLTLLGAFVPVELKNPAAHTEGEKVAIRTARLLAGVEGNLPFIILADDNGKDPIRTQNAGRIRTEQGLNDTQWQTFAEGTQRIAQAVKM